MLNETIYRIALQYQPFYGNVLIKKLIEKYESATNIFFNSEEIINHVQKRNRLIQKPFISDELYLRIDHEMAWIEKNSVSVCFYSDPNYPYRLKNCNDAPYLFYHKGTASFNKPKTISIVGTRHATQYGKEVVKRMISELAAYDVTVVSGLAAGIDTQAHEQAINHKLNTIAVLGSGLSVVYPQSNNRLFHTIAEGCGTVLSEYPFDTQPDRINFPRRNRIIAGLSDATIVIETAKKGGSIITAYLASSYHRDVFAVPGSVLTGFSEGCNELIRKNIAALVTSGNDIAEMMGWNDISVKNIQPSLFEELDVNEREVANIIQNYKEISVDDIYSHLSAIYSSSQIAGILLGLEIKGVVERLPGKCYKMW
ncbi:MAG: DNA-processing protein DprA [Bacteroidales bacterium]|jgi:DNA processing protein|nr:DNA-processing protein DprA [Bacteroidales bacterium]